MEMPKMHNAGPRFPVYSHENASCFHCEGDMTGAYWAKSGSAKGAGEYKQSCEKCGMTTWYDLSDDAEREHFAILDAMHGFDNRDLEK
jgi:hypothetical protein